MKSIVGLAGIVLMGIGIGTVSSGWKAGICAGLILMGAGLFIDAVRK
jgi:hypothetical protein